MTCCFLLSFVSLMVIWLISFIVLWWFCWSDTVCCVGLPGKCCEREGSPNEWRKHWRCEDCCLSIQNLPTGSPHWSPGFKVSLAILFLFIYLFTYFVLFILIWSVQMRFWVYIFHWSVIPLAFHNQINVLCSFEKLCFVYFVCVHHFQSKLHLCNSDAIIMFYN